MLSDNKYKPGERIGTVSVEPERCIFQSKISDHGRYHERPKCLDPEICSFAHVCSSFIYQTVPDSSISIPG